MEPASEEPDFRAVRPPRVNFESGLLVIIASVLAQLVGWTALSWVAVVAIGEGGTRTAFAAGATITALTLLGRAVEALEAIRDQHR